MICEDSNCAEKGYRNIVTEYSCFGNEYMLLCRAHYEEHMAELRKPKSGYCERCGYDNQEDIRPFQDPEEGSAACYLDTCKDCRSSINGAFCE